MIYQTENNSAEEIESLLKEFIEESVFAVKVDVEKIKNILIYEKCLVVVVRNEKETTGLMIACIYDHPLFNVKIASDLVVFVKKEFRGGLIALKLIKMYENWAKNQGVGYIFLGQSTGVGNIDRVKMFYEKLGFKVTGFNSIKGV